MKWTSIGWLATIATASASISVFDDGFDVDTGPIFVISEIQEHPDYTLRVFQPELSESKYKFDDVNYYTGYLDVKLLQKHFFYWFFESRNDPANDPVILWLNGGPGCSLTTGLFRELGPSLINSKIEPEFNPYSWNNNALVVFLDQPVGVGYSYTDDPLAYHNLTYAAANDVYVFLELFFKRFPQFQGREFHLAGESYGGHYLPTIAQEVLKHSDRSFNLTSVIIGNGNTNPLVQWPYFQPMVCGLGGVAAVVNASACEQMIVDTPKCVKAIEDCYASNNVSLCQFADQLCEDLMRSAYKDTHRSPYDMRLKCDEVDCDELSNRVVEFLRKPDVIRQVGAAVDGFVLCNHSVSETFSTTADHVRPFHEYVADLLDRDIPVLIYAGDKDWICNWLGNEAWTKVLEWKYGREFAEAKPHQWITADGEAAGLATNYAHFLFVRVFDAGHMVPSDQPAHAFDMLTKWLAKDYAFTNSLPGK